MRDAINAADQIPCQHLLGLRDTWDDAYSRLAKLITDIEDSGEVESKVVSFSDAPKKLYAIFDRSTNEMVFDALGFPYTSEAKAVTKLNTLKGSSTPNRYQIVHYVMEAID